MPGKNGEPGQDEIRKEYEPPKCGRNFYSGKADADAELFTGMNPDGSPIALTAVERKNLEKIASDNAEAKAKADAAAVAARGCPKKKCSKKEGNGVNAKVEPVFRKTYVGNPYVRVE